MKRFNFNKAVLLSALLILLAACDGLQGIGLEPQILNFTANPSTIKAGEGATLGWNVVGGAADTKVTLTPGDVDLDTSGNYQVTPEETTTYTLSVSSEGKTATRELIVTVTPREPVDPTPPANPPTENEPDVACGDGADLVPFEDANLQRAVEKALGLPNNGVSCYTVTLLENLAAQGTPDTQITDLSGLEFAKNLKVINLGKNNISDLSALGAITTLEQVYLYQNKISDLNPLASLSKLKLLELSYNDIGDIAPLLTLPWAAEDDYVGLKAQSKMIPQDQLTALEQLVSEVVYDEEDAGETPETPEQPGTPTTPEEPGTPEPGDEVIEGDVMVTNQADLDALAGVTEITGGLSIITVDSKVDSLDFSPLDKLRSVQIVSVGPNPNLKEVNGFGALESGAILIDRNDSLESLPDFSSLKTAQADISSPEFPGGEREFGIIVANNPKLLTLPTFENLESSAGLLFSANDAITSIKIGENLKSLVSDSETFTSFIVSENSSLTEISGFEGLTNATGFEVTNNPKLTVISGFSNLSIDPNPGGDVNSNISNNAMFDCSAAPQFNLPFFPLVRSSGNLVNCPTGDAPEQPDPTTDCPAIVNIPDPAFKERLQDQLGTTDDDISCEQLRSLTELNVANNAEQIPGEPGSRVTDVTGIEYAINLTFLYLNDLEGVELGFLRGLPKLEYLIIGAYLPDDLSPLTSLSNLKTLSLPGLDFAEEDISVVTELKTLQTLVFQESSNISVAPFAALPKLTTLRFITSGIVDFDELSKLTGLSYLELNIFGDITDISPLLALPWEGSDDTVIIPLGRGDNVPEEQLEALRQKVETVITSF